MGGRTPPGRSYDLSMSTTAELKVANYLMAVEGLAMIRRLFTDPSAVQPRADEIACSSGRSRYRRSPR
jgi:hypothetical protein